MQSSAVFRAPVLVCVALSASLGAAGCSKSSPSTTSTPAPAAAPQQAGTDALTGTVVGKTPAGTSAIVVLEPKGERSFPPQTETPVMDQIGATFSPELLLVRTGQPVDFRNSDDTLHNVHVSNSDTKEPSFNVAIPTGQKYTYTFAKDGFYHVGCDIHPAMAADLLATSSPFAIAAEPDGSFRFTDVPAGAYTLTAWVSGRKLQREVEVKAGTNQISVQN
ncbi:MAG: plastocyanin/azurin family copper-binding protein [Vicinamibacterales bacterium]